jgi:hypothetical protein
MLGAIGIFALPSKEKPSLHRAFTTIRDLELLDYITTVM